MLLPKEEGMLSRFKCHLGRQDLSEALGLWTSEEQIQRVSKSKVRYLRAWSLIWTQGVWGVSDGPLVVWVFPLASAGCLEPAEGAV